MLSSFFRRALPLLVFGSIALSSCTVHTHDRGRDYGRRGPDRGRGHYDYHDRHDRGYGYGRGRH
jgi:hypothetical protein